MVEKVGRVFVAVPLSPDARLALADQLEDLVIPGALVRPENWHITLRFLGTLDEVSYDRFLAALDSHEMPGSFDVSLDGVGGFPSTRRASVVWAGVVRGNEQLARLNERAEDAAQRAGLPAEDRPYRPHLTLARVRPPEAIDHLGEASVSVGFAPDRLVVYRSHMGDRPVRYEPLEEFDLSS